MKLLRQYVKINRNPHCKNTAKLLNQLLKENLTSNSMEDIFIL